MKRAARAALLVWLTLSTLGALNETVVPKFIGRSFDLPLPHLKSGHTMFVRIPRTVHIHQYAEGDGPRQPLTDLVDGPSPLYARARLEVSLELERDLLPQICRRSFARDKVARRFFADEYKLNFHPERPVRSAELVCDERGLQVRRVKR